MAFPTVAAENGGTDTGTSHTVNLPSNISYGDLLIVFFACGYQVTVTFPEGWAQLFLDETSYVQFGCWYRVADGSEGASIEVTTSDWRGSSHTTYRVTGYSGTPEAGTAVIDLGTAPDPPSLTPSWGAKDTLWLAAVGYFAGTATVTAYPTNYSNGRNDRLDNGDYGVGIGSARRELNAASEDPGTFTLSAWSRLISNTVAVQPAAGVVIPTVTTQAVSDIGSTTATGNGTIVDTGGENCTKRGVCWNTTGNPTVSDSKSEEEGSFGTGAFDVEMTGLTPNEHYYVRAYAYNSAGYGYGSQVEFDSLPELNSDLWEITVDSDQHNNYGLGYPVTYVFVIPSGVTAGKVYYKFSPEGSYEQLVEKTSDDFFNGINAIRFDFAGDRAYVSIAFAATSDKIYLKFTDGDDSPINVGFFFMADYYDNREAVVCFTADDLGSWSTDSFNLAMDACQARSIWITVGAQTDPSSPPDWSNLQSQINQGYVEVASHSRTHPNIPYEDYDSEIGGSMQDIKDNVDLPSIFKKGTTEYVWAWIEPYGESDATQRAKCGQYKYLADRSVAAQDAFSTWDATNGLFNRAGLSIAMGTDGETDPAVLNAKFDSVKSAGGIYHLMCHPENVDWSENEYAIEHLDYIKEKKDVWYVGFGALYQYRYVCVQADVEVSYTAVTEKNSSDTGSGAEASTQTATLTEAETGTGAEGLLARTLGLTETGAGLDLVAQVQAVLEGAETGSGSDLLSQAQAILDGAEAGSGLDAHVSLEIQQAKASSDSGSGVEDAPVHSAVLAGSETGSSIDAIIARLLASFDAGYGVEEGSVGGDGLLKNLFAAELGEGIDALAVKKEIFAGGEGTKFFGGGHRPPHRAS